MKEIPAVTGRGLSTAYRDAKLGKLKVRKSGRSSIVLLDDLMAWLGATDTTNP
ncbi:DNA-binding protein [Labrys sp. ZIDIC5]|uniref:DNA-binding protein n=1 Tax=Labrys sedimenti TaxID=3106036 RepID=UPI002ACAB829|nr:DNA-binding protein [Labrys sp. ZIDIC5]MDZ5448612.1 DNA-binding protein [Labrys sp. ZIDIC5]